MPLILAIEADRRQANQVSNIVRSRLRADLVIDESAERALRTLGDRVPDLVLTSTLLSPKDEAALAEWLRGLEQAAAHVQTLTIPVLGSAKPHKNGRRMLGLMGGRSQAAAPDGCDPSVFAEQCAEYLERAAAEHAQHIDTVHPVADAAAPDEPATESPVVAAEPTPAAPVDAAESIELDLSSMLDETVMQELSAAIESVTAAQMLAVASQQSPVASHESPVASHESPVASHESSASHESPVASHESSASHESPVASHESSVAVPDEMPSDVWKVGHETVWPTAARAREQQRVRASSPPSASAKARKAPKTKPVQDEWGIFDPEQCGFAALLAKLDEITGVSAAESSGTP